MSFNVRFDNITREEWEHHGSKFADYSVYQTWAYQQVRAGMDQQEVSRILIQDEQDEPLLMAQVRIKRIGLLGLRIGYVQWGPLVRGYDGDLRCSAEIVDVFRDEYLGKKVDVLRIVPHVWQGELGNEFAGMLSRCAFKHINSIPPYRTLVLDVGDSEDDIKSRLRKSYRRDLRYGLKAGVVTDTAADDDAFKTLEILYRDARKRKGFDGVDLEQFTRAQPQLSLNEKMVLTVAYLHDEPIAVHLASNLGDTSVVLIVACDEKALSCFGSYVLWYQGAVSAHNCGQRWCDLGGVDPKRNPNVYQFKLRMKPKDVSHLGTFEACCNLRARISWFLPARIHELMQHR